MEIRFQLMLIQCPVARYLESDLVQWLKTSLWLENHMKEIKRHTHNPPCPQPHMPWTAE